MAKRKRKQNYMMRRIFLLAAFLAVLALLGTDVWRLSAALLPQKEAPAEPEPSSIAQPEPELESESEPEPEPIPESLPEKDEADWRLLLVSGANPLPDDFSVPELETVTDAYQVDARIAEPLRRMFIQAKEDGIDLMVCSAYRTPEYQQGLLDRQIKMEMDSGKPEQEAVQAALAYVAKPKSSEHHTGLALDIVTPGYQSLDPGYADTPAAKWLAANAWEYGFVLRYPKDKTDITKINFEPWHYRYVGEEHAKVIQENGYCLEEYLYKELRKQEQPAAEQELEQQEGTG